MKNQSGFSLIEMAFVLVIVTLLLGGLLVPFATQVEQRRIAETQKSLEEIKEALLGYAITHGQLPCPDTSGDGVADDCSTSAVASKSIGGNLPWVDLGVANTDAWGQRFQYRVNGAFAGAISLSTTGTASGILRVCTDAACGTILASNIPAVIYSSGKNGVIQPPGGADELENTTVATNTKFDNTFVSHVYVGPGATSAEFDDIVSWLSPNILFNRMVAAGKLP